MCETRACSQLQNLPGPCLKPIRDFRVQTAERSRGTRGPLWGQPCVGCTSLKPALLEMNVARPLRNLLPWAAPDRPPARIGVLAGPYLGAWAQRGWGVCTTSTQRLRHSAHAGLCLPSPMGACGP